MGSAEIVVSGDLEENRIAELVASGAPIDRFGVGTDLGTSRDSPVVNGVYKLVADLGGDGAWRGVRKLSAHKETLPGPKQVYRRFEDGRLGGDFVGTTEDDAQGEPLLVPFMRDGALVREETMGQMRERVEVGLGSLPTELRAPESDGPGYPVEISSELRELGT
jgi:nicotinate phosphoribosyltransferase